MSADAARVGRELRVVVLALLLGVGGCQASSSGEEAVAGPCSSGRCNCQSLRCEEGQCKGETVGAGERCSRGRCGTGVCTDGQCVVEQGPDCSIDSDACQQGVCLPLEGCVTRPRPRNGDSCDSAWPLAAPDAFNRQVIHHADTVGCPDVGVAAASSRCPAAWGVPAAWHRLDLSAHAGRVAVRAVLDATEGASVELRRGPCGDSLSVDCSSTGLPVPASALLSAQVNPGVYWVVVRGAEEGTALPYQLQIELEPSPAGCAARPPNTDCSLPEPLSRLPLQTVLVQGACADDSVTLVTEQSHYYELDLSGEALPVLAHVSTLSSNPRLVTRLSLLAPNAQGEEGCGQVLGQGFPGHRGVDANDSQLSLLLEPGRYLVELEVDSYQVDDLRTSLSVQLDRRPRAPAGDSCASALVIDPSIPHHLIQGDTAPNSNQLTVDSCVFDGEAPDQFYRLDLRSAPAPVRLQAEVLVSQLTFPALLYVLAAGDDDASCGDPLYCRTTFANGEGPPRYDLQLEPGLYFLGVDGEDAGAGGRYQLQVSLEDFAGAPCLDATVDRCMFDNDAQFDCCVNAFAPDCAQALVLCGLSPQMRDCVCEASPACCGEGDNGACLDAWEACGLICPGFQGQGLSCFP